MGVHKLPRKRSALTRTIAAGGAAFCLSALSDVSPAPTANAVVIDDVPAGATAVGVPARIVKKKSERAA